MVTRVQTKPTIGASGTSASVTISTTAGNTLVIVADAYSSTNAAFHITSITDSAGNTWTFSTANSNSNPPVGQSWDGSFQGFVLIGAVVNAAALTSGTITVNFSASLAYCDLIVYEFSGVPAGSIISVANASSTNVSAASVTTPTVTVPSGASLAVAAQTNDGNAGSNTSVSSGWTTDTTIDTDHCSAWRVSPAAGSLSATFTSTSSQNWPSSAILVIGPDNTTTSGGMTFRPALAGTATSPVPVTTSGGMTFRPSLAGSGAGGDVAASGGMTFRPALQGTDIENFVSSGGLLFRPSLSGSSGIVPTFPVNPLAFVIELNLNGVWTDISNYVYYRDPINITDIGRPNESSTIQAGQCTLTLNNRDGRFTPKNPAGAYYPYIQRNTQIRVHVNAASTTGVNYSGYRFFGEVSEWPPTADTTGNDQYLQITASGIWRRLSRANTNIGSAYTRYNRTLNSIAGYWTMEDGSGSADFASGLLGQSVMAFTSGAPNLSSSGAFLGSDALPALNGSVLTGSISTASSPGTNRFRFAMFVPSGGDNGVPSGSILATLHTSGTVARVDVTLTGSGGGPVTIKGYNASNGLLFSADSSTVHTFGITLLAEVSLVQSGGNINYALNLYLPGGTSATASASGSIAGTVSDATSVVFNSGAAFKGTVVGQAIVLYSSPSLTTAADAINGHAGETAIARFQRICNEEGIPNEVIGASSVQMGPQFNGTISQVLQTVESSDQGLLYESRTQFGLGYRAYNSMVDQTAVVTLDYAAKMLSAVPVPTYDDQNIINDVTVNNYDGYSYRLQLASGAMSVQDPPNGVGDYPGQPVSVSLDSTGEATAVAQVAKRILNPGVVDEIRIPNVAVNLARAQVASLFGTIPTVFVGDYLAISNPPSWLSATSPSKQIVLGYSEVITNFGWDILFNTIPELGYESTFNPGTTSGSRAPGNTVTGSQSGSVSGAEIGGGAVSPGNLASYTNSASIGGITVSEGPTAPIDPNTGDLWINSSAGYQIFRFDGTNWNGIVFDATDVIQAGTITATQILAGTITASLLAAGIIVAGIVNGTTITGAQIVADGTSGQFLVYSGTPTTGNLILSVSAVAGTDGHSNNYNAGMWIYDGFGGAVGLTPTGGGGSACGLILTPGSTPPTGASGSTLIYGAASGAAQAVDGVDGQTYTVSARRSIVSGTGTVTNNGNWQTIHSSQVAASSAANRRYRINGLIYMTAANTLANSFNVMWVGPSGINGLIVFDWHEGSSHWTIGGLGPNTRGTLTISPSAGIIYECIYYGVVEVAAGTSGLLQVQGSATAAESSWNVSTYGYVDVQPV